MRELGRLLVSLVKISMQSDERTEHHHHIDTAESGRPKASALQVIGAVLATAFALWFLFGVPAYVLFNNFFE